MRHLILSLALIIGSLLSIPAFAQETSKNTETLAALEMNRVLIRELLAMHTRIQDRKGHTSQAARSFLAGQEKLERHLPLADQAREFIKDIEAIKPPTVTTTTVAPSAAPETAELKPLPPVTNAALHETALKLVAESKFKEAMGVYHEILMTDPQDDEAYLLLGHLSLLSGHYEDAEEYFFSALHIDIRNKDEIVPFYQNMLLKEPTSPRVLTYLGYVYLMFGEYLKAREYFNDALELDPLYVEAIRGMQAIYAEANKPTHPSEATSASF